MKNIFKTLTTVTFDSHRRSHDTILSARRRARESRIDPQAHKWGVSLDEAHYRSVN